MEIAQDVTLKLTEGECHAFVIELGELEGIADSLSPGGLNTMTGLVTLRNLRDLLERHGLGIRQQVLENEVAFHRSLAAQPPAYGPWVRQR